MDTIHLQVNKTARIFTLGQITDKTENIWLCLHGYAMLAEYFIKKFDHLDLEKNYIIAPEGLSKFYQSGLNGKIGASWMTSVDRLSEINDYVHYIEKVYQELIYPHLHNKKLILFGFSQGVSTLFRWANTYSHSYHKIIAWAGTIPNDVLENYQLKNINIDIYYGNEDPLFTQEQIQQYLQHLDAYPITYNAIEYKGGHRVEKELIEKLLI